MTETGKDRNDYARRAGIIDQAVKLPYDPKTNDEFAADAEAWFLQQYGLKKERYVGVDSCDLVIGRFHLDIKSTPVLSGRLIRHKDTQKRTHWCTAYVLVVGKPGSWEFRGWEWGRNLAKSWDDTLPTPAWALRQNQLRHDVDTLMSRLFGLTRKER